MDEQVKMQFSYRCSVCETFLLQTKSGSKEMTNESLIRKKQMPNFLHYIVQLLSVLLLFPYSQNFHSWCGKVLTFYLEYISALHYTTLHYLS